MASVTAKRFSIEEYHRLAELGFFAPDERVELIRGEIINMAAKGRPHSVCTSLLVEELVILLARRARVGVQEPIFLFVVNSEPEPDVVIARRADNYLDSHPEPADIFVVIEVSDSTLKYDKKTKLSLYSEAGISNYWIFNLVDTQLEIYGEPYQKRQGSFGYLSHRIVLPDESILIPGFPELSLDLSLVFPV